MREGEDDVSAREKRNEGMLGGWWEGRKEGGRGDVGNGCGVLLNSERVLLTPPT